MRRLALLVPPVVSALTACSSMPELDPQIVTEVAVIASKSCIDQYGAQPRLEPRYWRVREQGDVWFAWTPATEIPRKYTDCEYGVEISMSDRKPDVLGCGICTTAS